VAAPQFVSCSLPNIFECIHCTSLFATVDLVREHIRLAHTKPNSICCDFCLQYFRSDAELEAHKDKTHSIKYCCGLCSKVFKSLELVNLHKQNDHADDNEIRERFLKSQQIKLQEKEKQLKERQRLSEEKKKKKLEQAELAKAKKSSDKNKLQLNKEKKSLEKKKQQLKKEKKSLEKRKRVHPYFECDQCHLSFKGRQSLKIHSLVHTGKWPFMCATCGKGVRSNFALKMHELSHTGVKPFKCDQENCESSFCSEKSLNSHLSIVHGVGKNMGGTCEVCGKFYRRKEYLVYHIKTHDENRPKPHQCIICEKRFFTAALLRKHLESHEDARPLVCDICGKRYSRQGMIIHMSIHFEIKKHVCDVCGKAFVLQGTLKVHRRTHTGEKPFACVVCGQRFTQRSSQKIHERTQHNNQQSKTKNKKK